MTLLITVVFVAFVMLLVYGTVLYRYATPGFRQWDTEVKLSNMKKYKKYSA